MQRTCESKPLFAFEANTYRTHRFSMWLNFLDVHAGPDFEFVCCLPFDRSGS